MSFPRYVGHCVLGLCLVSLAAHGGEPTASNGPVSGSVEDGKESIAIVAGTEAKTAVAKIGTKISSGSGLIGTFDVFTLTLNAPLTDETSSKLATLDGLADAFTAALKWSHLSANLTRSAKAIELCSLAVRLRAAAEPKATGGTCDSAVEKYFSAVEKAEYEQAKADTEPGGLHHAYGFEVSAGTKDYEHLNVDTLSKVKESENPWGASAYYGRRIAGVLLLGQYSYQKTYKAGETKTYCPSISSGIATCATGAGGPPKATSASIFSLEGRGSLISWGIAPRVSFDTRNDVLGVDMPIYIWTDASGSLTSGINVGWRDDQSGIQAALFVGAKFSVMP